MGIKLKNFDDFLNEVRSEDQKDSVFLTLQEFIEDRGKKKELEDEIGEIRTQILSFDEWCEQENHSLSSFDDWLKAAASGSEQIFMLTYDLTNAHPPHRRAFRRFLIDVLGFSCFASDPNIPLNTFVGFPTNVFLTPNPTNNLTRLKRNIDRQLARFGLNGRMLMAVTVPSLLERYVF